MANSILEALYEGKLESWKRFKPNSPERKALERKIESEKNYLIDKLPSEDIHRLRELEDLYVMAGLDEELQIYSYGFSLGALIIMEVMESKREIISEQVN